MWIMSTICAINQNSQLMLLEDVIIRQELDFFFEDNNILDEQILLSSLTDQQRAQEHYDSHNCQRGFESGRKLTFSDKQRQKKDGN